jgi:putative N-acetylmannosamine-6-phosphate epimerase
MISIEILRLSGMKHFKQESIFVSFRAIADENYLRREIVSSVCCTVVRSCAIGVRHVL